MMKSRRKPFAQRVDLDRLEHSQGFVDVRTPSGEPALQPRSSEMHDEPHRYKRNELEPDE